jgi:DNA-binding CsgD family transcriptional regulator
MAQDLSTLPWVGLDEEVLGLYRVALTLDGSLEPQALASAAGTSVDAAADALAQLTELGFVAPYGAVAPTAALRGLLHRRLAEVHDRYAELEGVAESLDRIAARFLSEAPETFAVHGVELVGGAEEVGRRANDLIASARTELLVLNAPPFAQLTIPPYVRDPAGAPPATESEIGRAVLRGVSVRHVFAKEGLELPGRMAGVSELADLGMGVRVRAEVPTKLMVADRTTVLLPPSPAADPLGSALMIRDGLLTNALVPLFEAMWETAVPLAAVHVPPGGAADQAPPSDGERALLALLASGLKDEAIARQLDVHVHTARRRITALLTRLGATTRFQAGLQAARRGWLE